MPRNCAIESVKATVIEKETTKVQKILFDKENKANKKQRIKILRDIVE